jgi:DNA repair ATPase RecN
MRDIDYGCEDSRDYYRDKWDCNTDLYELWWKWQRLIAERKKEYMEFDKQYEMKDIQHELENIHYLLEKYTKKTDKLLKKVNKLGKKLDSFVVDEDDYFETECPCCGEPLDVYIYEE